MQISTNIQTIITLFRQNIWAELRETQQFLPLNNGYEDLDLILHGQTKLAIGKQNSTTEAIVWCCQAFEVGWATEPAKRSQFVIDESYSAAIAKPESLDHFA
ncbi:hypothetical protein VB735_22370 [Halotia wernerae UHCC 0503]|nr:hypothetical protein [Halotia wernerae UHCC 0503]